MENGFAVAFLLPVKLLPEDAGKFPPASKPVPLAAAERPSGASQ